MPSSYSLRLNVCLHRHLADRVFVRACKYTILASVFPLCFLAAPASVRPERRPNPSCNQERSSAVQVFPYRRSFPPRRRTRAPPETPMGGVGGALFIRVTRKADDGAFPGTAHPGRR